jgi:hypothetical protein
MPEWMAVACHDYYPSQEGGMKLFIPLTKTKPLPLLERLTDTLLLVHILKYEAE